MIFEAVVRPWLTRINNRFCEMLERVYMIVTLMITGLLRSTPTKALFTLLNWLPVDLMDKQIALSSVLGLMLWALGRHGALVTTRLLYTFRVT